MTLIIYFSRCVCVQYVKIKKVDIQFALGPKFCAL